jgi:peptidoglycan/xylan/chitin deacetylase (PgdA/CDA1 family)
MHVKREILQETLREVQAERTLLPDPSAGRLRAMAEILAYTIAYILRSANVFDRRPEVSVLMYHAVDHSSWPLAVTPQTLEDQFAYLARETQVVPLADAVAFARGEKSFTGKVTALTFDDGFADIETTVLPLLHKYGLHATCFLPTDVTVRTNSVGTPRMSWDAIRAAQATGRIAFEAHTCTHPCLSDLGEKEIRSEVQGCADEIERTLGKRPRFFAYPYGDAGAAAQEAVHEAGYAAGFGVEAGLVEPGDRLTQLNRLQVDASTPLYLFKIRLTRAIVYYRSIGRAVRHLLRLVGVLKAPPPATP